MSSGSYRQVNVKCPFYRLDDCRGKVVCEGIVEGSTVSLNFKNREDLNQQMDIFCCEYYKNCEVYRMLMEAKY